MYEIVSKQCFEDGLSTDRLHVEENLRQISLRYKVLQNVTQVISKPPCPRWLKWEKNKMQMLY